MVHRPSVLAFTCLLAGMVLSACERDREDRLRAGLAEWFFLSETLYFRSEARCTGAVITVTVGRPRPALAVQNNTDRAVQALVTDGIAAIQVDGRSPAELTEHMLTTGYGTFGRQVVAAGALAGDCFGDDEVDAQIYDALTRPGATLAYDSGNSALMILDPGRNRLFYVAGDAW